MDKYILTEQANGCKEEGEQKTERMIDSRTIISIVTRMQEQKLCHMRKWKTNTSVYSMKLLLS